MEVLSIKKYNEKQTKKWENHYDKAISEGRCHTLPQLAFYIFNHSYGYVAFDDKTALWNKSKGGVIQYWENEQKRKKIRGY